MDGNTPASFREGPKLGRARRQNVPQQRAVLRLSRKEYLRRIARARAFGSLDAAPRLDRSYLGCLVLLLDDAGHLPQVHLLIMHLPELVPESAVLRLPIIALSLHLSELHP